MQTQTIHYGSECWRLHADGAIERPGLVHPDARRWRIVGAVTRNNFGRIVQRYSLADIQSGMSIPWRHANGKQKTFVLDMDHGSLREWASPSHCVNQHKR